MLLPSALCLVLLLASATPAPAGGPDAPPQGAAGALLARPVSGTGPGEGGLAAVLGRGALPAWPVALSPRADVERRCRQDCGLWDRVDLALGRAADWLAAFPRTELRFDAAVILSQVRDTVDSPALARAFEHARVAAEGDSDNPQRRFWSPAVTAPAAYTSGWAVPDDGARVNPNRPLMEALHCRENGWRPATLRYVCGPMRDAGGFETTHALWALGIAFRAGCVAAADYEPCARALQAELAAAQPADFRPASTTEIDLYAQRLLHVVMTGAPDPAMNAWALRLLALQAGDGSWGIARPDEPPYWRYHATAIGAWALAEWYRRMVATPALRPDPRSALPAAPRPGS